jgi:putative colanic acid biosynthesis UDP-glucose lipid carrier transferase
VNTVLSEHRPVIVGTTLSLTRTVELLLDPLVIVMTLAVANFLFDHGFGKRYVLLSFIAFSVSFPGRPFLTGPRNHLVQKTLVEWGLFVGMLWLFAFASQYISYFPTAVYLFWFGIAPFAVIGARAAARSFLMGLFTKEGRHRFAVILGCNAIGARLAQNFAADPMKGVKCLGFFDDRSLERVGTVPGHPLLGTFAQLVQYLQRYRVDRIYLTLPMASQPRVLKILEDLRDTTASIFFVPDIFVTDLIQGRVENIDGMPVFAVCETPFNGLASLVKRLMDIVLSAVALVLLSPLLIASAIAVKLSSAGPIIFKQRRYGLDGREIYVYKFRTMTVTEDGDSQYKQVTRNDPRVTRVGAVLRQLSLDELPQLLNVLLGEMSAVGPRPHAVAVNEQYRRLIPGYMVRHKVKPGITGWAQVHGYRGGDDLESMTKRIQFDLDYLRKWSVGLDIFILLRTVRVLVGKDKQAY